MENKQAEESLTWAKCAAEAALSKKATDVLVLEVGPTLVIVDYFTLATADNPLQLKAAVEAVEERLRKEYNIRPIGREGVNGTGWVLLDYGGLVVHVFLPETRDFYRLESLYNDVEIIAFDDCDQQTIMPQYRTSPPGRRPQ